MLPTGEILSVRKRKSSGIPGFDDAVEQALTNRHRFPKEERWYGRAISSGQLQTERPELIARPKRLAETPHGFMKKPLHTPLLFSATLLMGVAAHAQLRVEIAGVGGTQIPVAVAAFAGRIGRPDQVSAIIRADLERSGVFKVIDAPDSMSDSASVDLAHFKASGADALVVGSRAAPGRRPLRRSATSCSTPSSRPRFSQLSTRSGARN
jgi:hypothetical protein